MTQTTHRSDEMAIARQINDIKKQCWRNSNCFDGSLWNAENDILRKYNKLSMKQWYVINDIAWELWELSSSVPGCYKDA